VKKLLLFASVSVFASLLSCTGRPAVVESAPPKTEPQAEVTLSTVDLAIQRVKRDSPDIKKYFVLDENGYITVKGEFSENQRDRKEPELFEVVYNLNFAAETQAASGYTVPFTLKSLKTGAFKNDSLLWKPQKGSAGILLSFDDDYEETWEKYFDFLDRYNAKVTFFIQGEYSPFCDAALERGHDVGFHTKNHLDLRKVSREVFDRETLYSAESFQNAGIPLHSFAYPYGFSDPWMNEELLKHYSALRGYGVTFRLYDKTQISGGFHSSKALDNTLFERDEDFRAAVDMMLRTVKFIGGNLVLPLTTHDISDTASWGIKPQRLEYFLQTANDLQLNFYTYRDLAGK
jgi:hypothetical protein